MSSEPETAIAARCMCGELETNRAHFETQLSAWHPFVRDVAADPTPSPDEAGPRTALAEALQVGVGPKRIEDYRPEEFFGEYADAILTALSERGYTIVASDRPRDAPCQHEACTDVYDSDSPANEAIVALAWALAERSADGPHGSNERRRFRPLARAFFRDLLRDPRRATAVRDALSERLGHDVHHSLPALSRSEATEKGAPRE